MSQIKNISAIALSFIILILGLCGCGKTVSNTQETVFHLYNQVNLSMTKQAVDKATGVKPVAETSQYALKNTFNYTDDNGIYGVCVVYNDEMKVFAKTVIYDFHSALAPFTKKPVTKDEVSKIKNDMSYSDVVKILGGNGIECNKIAASSDFKTFGLIRRWGNSDGSCIQIVFTSDDKVSNALFINAQ
jgi:predicted transcriptional regulator